MQIVIFAQKEFDSTIEEYANFADRINLYHILEPLGFKDTLRMIRFRLSQSSEENRIVIHLYISRIAGGLSCDRRVSEKNCKPVPQVHAHYNCSEQVKGRVVFSSFLREEGVSIPIR